MAHKLLSLLGTLLVVAGLAVLGYVGLSYARQSSATAPHWSSGQRGQGARIAARLRQQVKIPTSLKHVKLPRAGSEPALRIIIPSIDVNSRVVQTPPSNGVWDVADWAVGHLSTTPNPGGAGNGAYSGHDDIKGEVFKRIGQLKPGEAIELQTKSAVYTYIVTNQVTVDPSNISVLDPTRQPTVTLISCTPYWVDTLRVVIQGTLKSVKPV